MLHLDIKKEEFRFCSSPSRLISSHRISPHRNRIASHRILLYIIELKIGLSIIITTVVIVVVVVIVITGVCVISISISIKKYSSYAEKTDRQIRSAHAIFTGLECAQLHNQEPHRIV